MAITYHAGRRIQGLSTDTTSTFTSDLSSSTGWTTSDSGAIAVDTSNEDISWTVSRGSNDSISYDLGSVMSNTEWVLRFRTRWTTIGGQSATNQQWFGLSSANSSVDSQTAQYFIGFMTSKFLSTTQFRSIESYNSGAVSANGDYGSTPTRSANTWYYYEIKRTSATTFELSVSSTDAYTKDIIGAQSITITSSLINLRYIKMFNENAGTGNDGTASETKDFQFNNNTTSITTTTGDTKPTNVQVGSRFEETDTRKMYHAQDITGSDVSLTGLKAYYKFDASSGNIVNKASEVGSTDNLTGADMTITGATYDQTGIIDKALSFDGTNDYGTLGSSLSNFNFLHGTGDWSINFWVKYDEFIAEDRFLSNLDSTETRGMDMAVGWNGDPDGSLGMAIKSDNGFMVNQGAFTFPATVSVGTWVMITMTCDYSDTTNTYKVYLNGSAGGTQARGNTGSTGNSEYSLKLACRGNTSDRFFDGSFDELSIWQRELSQSEITAIYNSGSGKIISTDAVWKEEGT